MGAIAEGRVSGVFAGAQEGFFGFSCSKFQGHKFSAFVAAIAEGLVFGVTTGAPEIILAGFNIDRKGQFSRNGWG
jgi:hypothetical protein